MNIASTSWLNTAIALIEAAWVQQQLGDCATAVARINTQLA